MVKMFSVCIYFTSSFFFFLVCVGACFYFMNLINLDVVVNAITIAGVAAAREVS
jgi:hypothetical protein